MNLYFILEWYLNKMTDQKFLLVWETKYLQNPRKLIRISVFFYLLIVLLLSNYVSMNTGIFIGILFFGSFGVVFAILFFVSYLRFMSNMNMRYLGIKSGTNNDIDYSNVVN